VSAYLSRLLARGRPADGTGSLQPFVRSRSPIAEHDQRIGIPGLEAIGTDGSSPDEARTEPMPPQRTMPEPLPPVSITADRGSGEVTLRRKPDSPVSMTAGLSVPTAVTHSTPGEGHHSTPGELHHRTLLRASSAGIGDRIDTPVRVTRAFVVSPERDVAPNLEQSPAVTDDFRPQPPLPSEDGARSPLGSPVAVRRRSVRDTPEVDTAPRLEPSPRIFPDPIETSVAAAGMARADAGPREVIDQGNVDGVPPPVSTETKAPARTGPLTAASVSVIGPLGGNLASRMAFGLRYR
jgi:hypothetical protein